MTIATSITIEPTVSGGTIEITSPADYTVRYYIPSVVALGAAGRPYVQALTANPRREFILRWNVIGSGNVDEAFWFLCGEICTFTDPQGNEYSVIRHPEQPKLRFKGFPGTGIAGVQLFYSTELRMIEAD